MSLQFSIIGIVKVGSKVDTPQALRHDLDRGMNCGLESQTVLTPVFSSMILMPDMDMLTQILCLCLPWDREAIAMPCKDTTTQ
jgi:hypothetical protein